MANVAAPVSFAGDLDAFGGRLAVVTSDGAGVSYAGLAERVTAMQCRLGAERRLVLLAASNDIDSLVTYLAAVRAGHPVLMTAAPDRRRISSLVDAYDPDVVVSRTAGSWQVDERRERSAHTLHPDLALLLSTSGSTGSPKLVRLSAANLAANAAAIAEYLDIRDTDRAAASLPLHYCYGLSVVNSNLLRGAAVLLSDRSVTDPQFWTTFRDQRGTSLHGVPYTFELFDSVGFPRMRLPDLRYVTQAGGRLDPADVRRYAELGDRSGWRLFVMYGQTEATARMAYLPPELAAACPSAIGVPIPGGSFEIDASNGADEGELIYRGPNVMLGYARGPTDLARGRTVEELRTGDLARRRPDGLVEVVGRRSRLVKPFGLRIDLDDVERVLAGEGYAAACTGTDEELVVAVAGGPGAGRVRHLLADRLALPPARIRVVPVAELPRGANGKIDHRAVGELTGPPGEGILRCARMARRRRHRSVHDAFAAVFPDRPLPPDATFVGLGGDSLSYVRMTLALQRVLGELPPAWHVTPIDQLARRTPRRRSWPAMETGVVLRAVAIVLVVGSHIGLYQVLGGAHLLLGVAGWAFARFVLTAHAPATPGRMILRSLTRIAVPGVLWIGWRALVEDDVHLQNALLINYVLDPSMWGYWFVETLVQTLLLLAVVFAVPAVRRLERARPFGFAVAALAYALTGRLFTDTGNEFSDRLLSTHLVLWLFALGWVVHRARTRTERAAAAALVVLLVPGFFDDPVRTAVVTAGLLLLLLVPGIPLPRRVHRPVGAVAGASLAIYLTHYAVYPGLLPLLPPLAVIAICLVVGVAAQCAVTTALRHRRVVSGLLDSGRRRPRRAAVVQRAAACPPANPMMPPRITSSAPIPRPSNPTTE